MHIKSRARTLMYISARPVALVEAMGFVDWLFSLLGLFGLHTKHKSIVFLGLDNAGKTTLMHLLIKNELLTHTPTVHPTSEEMTVGGVQFTAFDLGGHEQARRVWKDYTTAVDAVVFIIDMADRERSREAHHELHALLACEDLIGVPFLVLGNKIDVPGSMTEQEARQTFTIPAGSDVVQAGMTPIALHMCSLVQRRGYTEGFKWIGAQRSRGADEL